MNDCVSRIFTLKDEEEARNLLKNVIARGATPNGDGTLLLKSDNLEYLDFLFMGVKVEGGRV